MMTDGKFDKRLEVVGGMTPGGVRVYNSQATRLVAMITQVSGDFSVLSMSPDEADQLAEMLRLSACGLRGESGHDWKDVHGAGLAFKAAHDAEAKRVLEAAGVDANVIYDAFHNASIKGGAAARKALSGVQS